MRWIDRVVCSYCDGSHWLVRDGGWKCDTCGKAILASEIKAMQEKEDAG